MRDQDMGSQINGHLLPITQTHVYKIYILYCVSIITVIYLIYQLLPKNIGAYQELPYW